ncbi:MAG: hypothetical protein AAF449_24995, partial [Myxococcota bacterium]
MRIIMVDLAPFQLSPTQLAEVRDSLAAAIEAGLAVEGQQVAALPGFLAPPDQDITGEALVVDTGGTNMRAAWVELSSDETPRLKAGPLAQPLELRGDKRVDRAEFFRMQAALVEALGAPKGLPVGYCFSYPSEILPNLDARLLKWTKGIDLPDVVNTRVGEGLMTALDAIEPKRVCVLNDTVAALLAASLTGAGDPEHGVGLIVGTGTNMACYADAQSTPKLSRHGGEGAMAINLESGNFHPPHLTAADEIVDRESTNPGEQRFEKAMSGFYLPFIFKAAYPEFGGFDPHTGTQVLADMQRTRPDSIEGRLAGAILNRAADLVGAGLAAVIGRYGSGAHASILAEGSLYWRGPGFAARAETTLQSLLPPDINFTVHRIEDANLFGAAAAALAG